jgi:cadmium resistance protein CadD (predicted permease)
MTEPWATLLLAFVAFAADIDDLLLLAAFFADPRLDCRSIVLGQFLGIGTLFAASAIAAWLAIGIPAGWIALLGLAPLFLGLRGLWRVVRGGDGDDDDEAEHAQEQEAAMEVRLRSQALAVASVTIANGGDNLAVYVPVFAASPDALGLFAAVFVVMTAAWCAAGYLLVNNRLFGAKIQRYGDMVLPVVLVALGAYILRDAAVLLR